MATATCIHCGQPLQTTGEERPECAEPSARCLRLRGVLSLDAARKRRDDAEERRLEQLVIERWTGKL